MNIQSHTQDDTEQAVRDAVIAALAESLNTDGWSEADTFSLANAVYDDAIVSDPEKMTLRDLAADLEPTYDSPVGILAIADYPLQMISDYYLGNDFVVRGDGAMGLQSRPGRSGYTFVQDTNGRFWITNESVTLAKPRRPAAAFELLQLKAMAGLLEPDTTSEKMKFYAMLGQLDAEIERLSHDDANLLAVEATLAADGWSYFDSHDIAATAYADGVVSQHESKTLAAMNSRHEQTSIWHDPSGDFEVGWGVSLANIAVNPVRDVSTFTDVILTGFADGGSMGGCGFLPGTVLSHTPSYAETCIMLDNSMGTIAANAGGMRFFFDTTAQTPRPAALSELIAFQALLDTAADPHHFRGTFEPQLIAEISRLSSLQQ